MNITTLLNELLANYHVMYHNFQACHWNIKGDLFFDLHDIYGQHYDKFGEMIDEVAERIAGLQVSPISNQETAAAVATLQHFVKTFELSGYEANSQIYLALLFLAKKVNEVLRVACDNYDFATKEILMDHIADLEKLIWKYRSFNTRVM